MELFGALGDLICFPAGMIIPYVVSYSLMFGAVISNGIMWPLISAKEGDWYPAGQSAQSFQGLFGYKVSPTSQAQLACFRVVVSRQEQSGELCRHRSCAQNSLVDPVPQAMCRVQFDVCKAIQQRESKEFEGSLQWLFLKLTT